MSASSSGSAPRRVSRRIARRSRASSRRVGMRAAVASSAIVGVNGARSFSIKASAMRSGSNGRKRTRLPAAKARSLVPAPTASSTDAPPKRLASTMPASAGVSAKASFSVARICTPEIHATTSTGSAIAACATGVAGLAIERANQKRARPRRVSGFAVPISRRPSSGERSRSALSATRAAGVGRSAARPPSVGSTLVPVSSG